VTAKADAGGRGPADAQAGRVICLGELLIDFCAAEADVSLAEARTFAKAPGGAPANVAVGVARLGTPAGLVAAVGADPFGDYLASLVAAEGVDTAGVVRIPNVRTSLAFIAARSDGAKDITFYRHPGADMCLSPQHLPAGALEAAGAFHFGSISRIDPDPRAATDEARRRAAAGGALVSYDPNWRPTLWPDADAARGRILEGFAGAHVAKVSAEEWQFVTGESDFAAGAARLHEAGAELVVRSEGADGASFATRAVGGHVDARRVDVVDTLGAGDACMACLIVDLLAHWRAGRPPGELDAPELRRIVRRAVAAGAVACTRVGAIPALPTRAELEAVLTRER